MHILIQKYTNLNRSLWCNLFVQYTESNKQLLSIDLIVYIYKKLCYKKVLNKQKCKYFYQESYSHTITC